jgi:hypothetical protein
MGRCRQGYTGTKRAAILAAAFHGRNGVRVHAQSSPNGLTRLLGQNYGVGRFLAGE